MSVTLGILVVEDEAAHALALQQSLAALGHHVLGLAMDGYQALNLRRQLNPDLVIMDIHLPGLDGMQAASQMNRDQPLPVVLVTAYADQWFKQQAREAGVYSYLVKPVEAAVLGPAIELTFENHQRWQHLERQVIDLREELRTRKVVERAKGILMDTCRLSEKQAQSRLDQQSQHQGLPLLTVAEKVIAEHGQPPARRRV